jgi:hypothetical protein
MNLRRTAWSRKRESQAETLPAITRNSDMTSMLPTTHSEFGEQIRGEGFSQPRVEATEGWKGLELRIET